MVIYFYFFVEPPYCFNRGGTILHSHQQWTRGSIISISSPTLCSFCFSVYKSFVCLVNSQVFFFLMLYIYSNIFVCVCVKSLGYFTQLSVRRDNCTNSFPIQIPSILFPCLIVATKTFSTLLYRKNSSFSKIFTAKNDVALDLFISIWQSIHNVNMI